MSNIVPEKPGKTKKRIWTRDEDVVITGMAGRFPQSYNVEEFWQHLLDGTDLSTIDNTKWPIGYFGLPAREYFTLDDEKFDAEFFEMGNQECNACDNQLRTTLEVAYEAICDAGINPEDLFGSKTGVVNCSVVANGDWIYWAPSDEVVPSRQKYSQIVSEKFGLKGPVLFLDAACGSSFLGINVAHTWIKSGMCDRVIIVSHNNNYLPGFSKMLYHLQMESLDGLCKCLDETADGYGRGDAFGALMVQVKPEARRVYCTVANTRSNCDGYRVEGIIFSALKMKQQLIKETYEEIDLNLNDIIYCESHATGTQTGDFSETSAITNVAHYPGRKTPIYIGCLKSCVGHSEGTSGISAIVKVIKIFEKGIIPKNQNFSNLNMKIPALRDGKALPVLENMKFDHNVIPLNSYGFGGINNHIVLLRHDNKQSNTVQSKVPYLINICGRTLDGIIHTMKYFEDKPAEITADFLALFNESMKNKSDKMKFRGYLLFDKAIIRKEITELKQRKKLWFIFPGYSDDLIDNISSLLSIDIISQSVAKSLKSLNDPNINDSLNLSSNKLSVLQRLVLTVALQIGLIDLLNELNIKADNYFGYSFGQFMCAYYGGSITREQLMATTFHIGAQLMKQFNLNMENGFIFYQINLKKLKNLLFGTDGCLPKQLKTSPGWISRAASEDNQISTIDILENLMQPQNLSPVIKLLSSNTTILEVGNTKIIEKLIHNNHQISYLKMLDNTGIDGLLSNLGRIYMEGFIPQIQNLYPKVEFPVPSGTPTISHLIKWDHSKDWFVSKYPNEFNIGKYTNTYTFDLKNSDSDYLADHVIDGRIIFPVTGYFAMAMDLYRRAIRKNGVPIEMRDINFLKHVMIPASGSVKFTGAYNYATGRFDILENGSLAAQGTVISSDESPYYQFKLQDTLMSSQGSFLDEKFIYKELKIRGYEYGPAFQNIVNANETGTRGSVTWNEKLIKNPEIWQYDMVNFTPQIITICNAILHIPLMGMHMRLTQRPVLSTIDQVIIDLDVIRTWIQDSKYRNMITDSAAKIEFPVVHNPTLSVCASPGIYMSGHHINIYKIPTLADVQEENEIYMTNNENEAIDNYYATDIESYKKEIYNVVAKIEYRVAQELRESIVAKDQCIQVDGSSHSLLMLLNEMLILKEATKSVSKELENYENFSKIVNDLLIGDGFCKERFIRPLIDLIVENSLNPKIEFAEINDSKHVFGSKLNDMINNWVKFEEVNYTLLHNDDQQFDDDATFGITVKKVDYKAASISELVNKDAVILKINQSSKELDILFHNLYANMKNSSFLIILANDYKNNDFVNTLVEWLSLDKYFPGYSMADSEKQAVAAGFTLISKKSMSVLPVYGILLRKCHHISESVDMIIGTDYENWLEELKKKISTIDNERIWLQVNGQKNTGVNGLIKALRNEPSCSLVRCIISDQNELMQNQLTNIKKMDLKINVINNGKIGTYREVSVGSLCGKENSVLTENAYLALKKFGDLSSFKWYEQSTKLWSEMADTYTSTRFIIDVYSSSINFKDLMLATGNLPVNIFYGGSNIREGILGSEFAGIDQNGNRVMGLTGFGGLATKIISNDPLFIWPIPENWKMEEAATIPYVYSAAYYGLILRAKLTEGESILIHSGCGGLGQAAISICLSMKCNVFTTVGSDIKKKFLMEKFPKLREDQIFNSRNIEFEEKISIATEGNGVNVVVNSLSKEKLFSSLRCLSKCGRFLEYGKVDLIQDSRFDVSSLKDGITIHGIAIDKLFDVPGLTSTKAVLNIKRQIRMLICEGIISGVVKPLNFTEFTENQVEKAFRLMATGHHIGKILIKLRNERLSISKNLKFNAIPQAIFNPLNSYVIIGGLGGIGLEMAYWLVKNGVTKLIIASRKGVQDEFQSYSLQRLEELGAKLIVSQLNVSSKDEAKQLIELANNHSPVGGIFNCAVSLMNTEFSNQNVKSFRQVCDVKINGTQNLDELSRQLCPQLKYFLCFSSIIPSKSELNQFNYHYANSAMEKICEKRVMDGLPGLTLRLGMVADVGFNSDNDTAALTSAYGSIGFQKPISIFNCLSRHLNTKNYLINCFSRRKLNAIKTTTNKAFFNKILEILDEKEDSALMTSTLAEIGMDSIVSTEITLAFETFLGIKVKQSDLREMKLIQLKDLY